MRGCLWVKYWMNSKLLPFSLKNLYFCLISVLILESQSRRGLSYLLWPQLPAPCLQSVHKLIDSIPQWLGRLVLGPLTGEAHLPHDWFGSHVCTVEQRVPIGQEGVALSDGFSDEPGVFLPKEPGFPSLGVHGGMATKEGLVGSGLVPTH